MREEMMGWTAVSEGELIARRYERVASMPLKNR